MENNFLVNPQSDWEERRKKLQEDYRRDIRESIQERAPVQRQEENEAPGQEDYFIFGAQGTAIPSRTINSRSNRPRANWGYDQLKSLQDQKNQEWRESLRQQLEEKKNREKQAQMLKLKQEQDEDQKLKKELEKLNIQHQKEMAKEKGRFAPENNYNLQIESKEQIRSNLPEQKTRLDSKDTFSFNPSELPKNDARVNLRDNFKLANNDPGQQGIRENPINEKPFIYEQKRAHQFALRNEFSSHNNTLTEIVNKLKEEATNFTIESTQTMNELQRFQEEMRNPPQLVHVNSLPKFHKFGNFRDDRYMETPARTLRTDSTFLPLKNAGSSILKNNPQTPLASYSGIADQSAKDHLAKLDLVLQQSRFL